jgi:hypothetical protein
VNSGRRREKLLQQALKVDEFLPDALGFLVLKIQLLLYLRDPRELRVEAFVHLCKLLPRGREDVRS